jgi:hypothetical protein
MHTIPFASRERDARRERHYYDVTILRFGSVTYRRLIVGYSADDAIARVRSHPSDACTANVVTDPARVGAWGDPNDPDAPFQE